MSPGHRRTSISFEVSERTFGMDGTDLDELKMLNEK